MSDRALRPCEGMYDKCLSAVHPPTRSFPSRTPRLSHSYSITRRTQKRRRLRERPRLVGVRCISKTPTPVQRGPPRGAPDVHMPRLVSHSSPVSLPTRGGSERQRYPAPLPSAWPPVGASDYACQAFFLSLPLFPVFAQSEAPSVRAFQCQGIVYCVQYVTRRAKRSGATACDGSATHCKTSSLCTQASLTHARGASRRCPVQGARMKGGVPASAWRRHTSLTAAPLPSVPRRCTKPLSRPPSAEGRAAQLHPLPAVTPTQGAWLWRSCHRAPSAQGRRSLVLPDRGWPAARRTPEAD